MKILFSAIGGRGHVVPLLPLADAASAQGHPVAFLVPPSFVEVVRPHAALVAGPEQERINELTGERVGGRAREDPGSAAVENMAGVRVETVYPDAVAAAREFGPDLLICSSWDLVGPLVAATLERPWVEFAVTGYAPDELRTALAERVAPTYQGLGLRPHDALTALDPYLDTLRLDSDPVLADRIQIQTVPPGSLGPVVGGSGPGAGSTVLVTLGSATDSANSDEIIAAVLAADCDVTVTSPPRPSTHDDRVQRVGYRPLGPLLEHCSVVVGAGGTGTTLAALAAGVPMVLIPSVGDQAWNAERVARAGAGIALERPDGVTSALRQLSQDLRYRDAARRLADENAVLTSPSAAIERLVMRLS